MSKERRQRYLEIMEMRKSGLTMAAIGRKLGISRERVRQLINKGGRMKKRKFFLSVYRAGWLTQKGVKDV